MSEKDFIALAEALRKCKPDKNNKTRFAMWDLMVRTVAHVCRESNPYFKYALFYDACGLIKIRE